jgi:hypothetical protein
MLTRAAARAEAGQVPCFPPSGRVALATSSGTQYAPLLKAMLSSFYAFPESKGMDLLLLDLGLDKLNKAWLEQYSPKITKPQNHFELGGAQASIMDMGVMARPFLREYFPGYDTYIWLDADVWVQRWSAISKLISGANGTGLAIAREWGRGYRLQPHLFAWGVKHSLLGHGVRRGCASLWRPHLNAGVFALNAKSPHWDIWLDRLREAVSRTGKVAPYDQFSLSLAAYDAGPAALLGPTTNWICAKGVPMWNDDEHSFCVPHAPYTPLEIVHLAGEAKFTKYRVRRTGGGTFLTYLALGSSPERTDINIWD